MENLLAMMLSLLVIHSTFFDYSVHARPNKSKQASDTVNVFHENYLAQRGAVNDHRPEENDETIDDQVIEHLPPEIQFEDFPIHNDVPIDAARTGIADAFRLAATSVRALRRDPLSSSYYRYFSDTDKENVLSVMQLILQRSTLYPALCEQAEFSNKKEVVVWWDDPVGAEPHCHGDGNDRVGATAYFIHDQEASAADEATWNIVICPTILTIAAHKLDDIPCSSLDSHATQTQMEAIGRVLLHEMVHAPEVAVAAGISRTQIQDYQIFIGSDDEFTGLQDGDIVPAYGPFWSRYVNIEQGCGTWNADNYAWFAIEEFFRAKCHVDFADAPRNLEEETKIHGYLVP